MLQSIRDKSQGWIAWSIIGLLIATFALWGIHTYITEEKNSDALATVNGISISQQAVQTAYERLRQQQQLQLGANFSLNQAAEAQLKKQALNQLVVSTLLIHAAQKAGYRVTTNQVDEALLQIPAFQVNGQFSIDRFHEILTSILYSQDQFLADMRQSMLINQMQGGYVNSAFALPNEVMTAIRLVNQKRDIRYAIIPAARFASTTKISPAETKAYYQEHQKAFESPEQASVSYLVLSLPAIKASLHFDQTKLQQYYENNLQNYTQPASWHVAYILFKVPTQASADEQAALLAKAKSVQAKAQAGENFATLAQTYSDDTASSKKGGELPWFTAGTLDPAFEKAAASLQKVGDISAPVKTRYGYILIKLLGEHKAQVLPFDQVKTQVTNALAEQQAEQIFAEKSDKLSNLTYANPNSLTIASQALDLPVQQTGFFTRQGTKTGISANPRVITATFSNDVLSQHNNSDVLQIDPNTVIVLRINQYKPAMVLPFAEVENAIQTTLIHQKARQQAEQVGQQLLTQMENQQATPTALAERYHFPWQVDNNVGRFDARVDNAILREAFRMPRPNGKPSVSGMRLPSGDYALIRVDAVRDGSLPANGNLQQRIFTEQLEHNNGMMDYEFYVRGLMKQAKIKVHQNLLTKPGNH